MKSGVLFVFKKCVGYTQVIIWMDSDWQFTRNWIPRIFVHFPNRCVTKSHLSHFIVCTCWPKNFYLFPFWVSNYLSCNVTLICFVKDIETIINNQVGKIYFFIRSKTHLLNSKSFTSSNTRNTSHYLINVRWLKHVIPRCPHLTIEFFYIFHSPGSIICGYRTWLTHWMNVSHVINRWWWVRVECFYVCINIFCSIIKLLQFTYVGSSSGIIVCLKFNGL